MSSNIYEYKDTVIVCGSCMPNMDQEAFRDLINKYDVSSNSIFFVCLEEVHMNMVAHKIASFLRLGKVKTLVFASVDNSPHCVQLHYIRNELEKMMDLSGVEIVNYVSNKSSIVKIEPEIISNSKNLVKLSELNN